MRNSPVIPFFISLVKNRTGTVYWRGGRGKAMFRIHPHFPRFPKTWLMLACLLPQILQLQAQDRTGLTGIKDSSYSIMNEYRKHLKKYPEIRVVSLLKTDSVQEIKNLVYGHAGNRELKLDIFKPQPRSSQNRVAIIFLHGGGWRSGEPSMHHALAQRLALRGYLCITPEYRLSTEALYPAALEDIKAAVRWVRKHARQWGINPGMIAIAGHSAGGHLAALTGTTGQTGKWNRKSKQRGVSSEVNAVIDIDGTLSFVHPLSSEIADPAAWSYAARWLGYTPAENRNLFQEASPLSHAGPQCPPFLFLNSPLERMHAGQAELIDTLKKYHIYSDVKLFENAPHSFCFFDPWFDPMLEAMDIFLQKIFPRQ